MRAALLAVLIAVFPARAAVVRLEPSAAPVRAITAPAASAAARAPLAAAVNLAAPAALAAAPIAAAAAPVSAAPAAVAAAVPATPAGKIGAFLSRMANPFGSKDPGATAQPASLAQSLDQDFAKLNIWDGVAPAAKAEIEDLRARKLSKAEVKDYVRAQAAAAFERVKAARGASNVAFHYNLHGGAREGYVGAGIRASKGDIALRYSMNADANDKVYFFQTAVHDPYTALDASNGEILFFPSRMGSVLSVFDLGAPEIQAAVADGRIAKLGAISMDFHKGMRGVPYSAFLAPPLRVFDGTAKKIGLKKLSRDEETLATVRYLEAALTAGGAYVPKAP